MKVHLQLLSTVLLLLASTLGAQGTGPSDDAIKYGSSRTANQGMSREATWPAPTAQDWAKPCLIQWERTWEDALKVARDRNMPIMVCVNMDGEIASEHFAGIKYRNPETAVFYEPYVCVIASVYRHNPRDYDEEGNRIPCPRFGHVTCGEHIAMERILFEKFFEGRRIAPRHIEVEPDGTETFDIYYAWDTQTIFTGLRAGVEGRPDPNPDAFGDRPEIERVASSAAADRKLIETMYRQGTREVRRKIIEATMRHRDVDQVDLLRQAIFGFDVELARLARKALVQCDSEKAIDLIAEALKVPMNPEEREELLGAARRLAEKYPRAQTLLAVHQGLGGASTLVSGDGWRKAGDDTNETSARQAYTASADLERRVNELETRPDDGQSHLELAESLLARAYEPSMDRRFLGVLREDARRAARLAVEKGATGWRVDAVLACTAHALGDRREALTRAVAAVEGGMPAPGTVAGGIPEPDAITVLALFAQARQRAVARAYRERNTWPPEWLSDIHAAYDVLAQHPLGTDQHVTSLFDFLDWLGATPKAKAVLEEGLTRFPSSAALHGRLRRSLLWEKGPDGLEAGYAQRLTAETVPPDLEWFAGYASLVAAEHHRRASRFGPALASYARGIELFEKALVRDPSSKDSVDHFIALAYAGRGRVVLEQGKLKEATDEILASFTRLPDAAATPDGLNITAADTAKMLRTQLKEAGAEEDLKRLQAALDALDPRLLELPAYERGTDIERRPPPPGRRRGDR